MRTGVISGMRVTHRHGSVDDIARSSPESQRLAVATLCSAPEVEEAFVISTCNRTEAYVVTPEASDGRAALEAFFDPVDDDVLVSTEHDESLRHLLRVATGLESVIIGEDQIIGQVRTAYEDARSAGGIGQMLEAAVTKAIHVGERARTETAINEGIVSLGSAAVELAASVVALEGERALVVGAGEMGQLAARSLADSRVAEVTVANRTIPHAEHTADKLPVPGRGIGLEALEEAAQKARVIVTATGSPKPLIGPPHVGEHEQVIVDLGQPRDVSPRVNTQEEVTVYDLDDLESITEATRVDRLDAAREVEAIISEEVQLLDEQYKRARADEVIAAMYASAERLKQRELETAFSRLEATESLTEEHRQIIEAMADSLVGQLLAPPTKSLREAAAEDDWETINTALHLFDPSFSAERSASAMDSSGFTGPGDTSIGITDDD